MVIFKRFEMRMSVTFIVQPHVLTLFPAVVHTLFILSRVTKIMGSGSDDWIY
jgi:hypothetical protein